MRDAVTIRWLGQAGFVLGYHPRSLLLDPWLAPHPDRLAAPPLLEELPRDVAALLATHEHGDHLDLASLPALTGLFPDMRVVVPEPLVELVRRHVGATSPIVGARPGQWADIGDGARVLATPAWHGVSVADGYTDGGWSETGASRFVGYVVKLDDVTVYHAGDTIAHPALIDFLRPLDIDIALLPINGRDARREHQGIVGNLDAVEALDLATEIGARVLVPMHYDMVRGNEAPVSPLVMLAERRAPGPRVWCLERGRSYELPGPA